MKHTLTWLHLSDLHLCSPKTGWKATKVIDTLKRDLSLMSEDYQLKPDLLFFTGDLVFGHLGAAELSITTQFKEVQILLNEVCQLFNLKSEQVFIVPGNHDINRHSITEMQNVYLESITNNKNYDDAIEKINNMLNCANSEWQQFMQRLNEYINFLQEYYPHLLQDKSRLTYAIEKNINGLNVGIAGFNSAWSCGGDKEKGKIWLGGKWQIETLSHKLKQSDIKIALAHHPLTWLVEQENPSIDPLLEQQFDFFLHGHEHQGWVDIKDKYIRLAAGACYGEKPLETGYSFVRLDFEQEKGEAWLRKFDDTGLGWIPRIIPHRTDNNGLWALNNLAWLSKRTVKKNVMSDFSISKKIICQKIEKSEFIDLSAVNLPYDFLASTESYELDEVNCMLWLPCSQYITSSPLQNQTPIVCVCIYNLPDVLNKLDIIEYAEIIKKILEHKPHKLLNEDKVRVFQLIGHIFSEALILAVTLPKNMLLISTNNPAVIYDTMLNSLLLPVLQMNKKFGINVFNLKLSGAEDKLQQTAKRLIKAIYNKKTSFSVEFIDKADELKVIGKMGSFINWAVGAAHNTNNDRWIVEINKGINDEDFSLPEKSSPD